MSLHTDIEQALGEPVRSSTSVSGGCIAEACTVTLNSGRTVFVKSAPGHGAMFLQEANGLRALREAEAIKVPEVLHAAPHFLVLEQIVPGRPRRDFMAEFGRRFAAMHRHTADTYGFMEDNFIGSTPQQNTPTVDHAQGWCHFYWEYRLLYQQRLAERNGYATEELTRLMGALEGKIEEILAGSEKAASVLHGDLWSGNYMCDADGEPVLIDPAVYYGNREADLGMTRLFGGFDSHFYAAYEETYPLADGAAHRENVYKLYHILNHLNLFGHGYYQQSISLLRSYV